MKKLVTSLLVCLTVGLSSVASADPALKRSAESYGWNFVVQKDEMTDKRTYRADKVSETYIEFMNSRTRQFLSFIYDEESKDRGIIIYLGGNSTYVEPTFEATSYLVRVDDKKALSLKGERIWRGEGLFFPYNKQLINQIRQGSVLKVRIPTLGKGTHVIEFDLRGAESAIDYLNGK